MRFSGNLEGSAEKKRGGQGLCFRLFSESGKEDRFRIYFLEELQILKEFSKKKKKIISSCRGYIPRLHPEVIGQGNVGEYIKISSHGEKKQSSVTCPWILHQM